MGLSIFKPLNRCGHSHGLARINLEGSRSFVDCAAGCRMVRASVGTYSRVFDGTDLVRLAIGIVLIGLLSLNGRADAQTFYDAFAQYEPESLRSYAVNINQNPQQPWPGYGIYLGNGLVISAAHVVGSAARTKPTVLIGDLELRARAVREGSYHHVDVTLLSVDELKLPASIGLRRMPLCETPPIVGEPVNVAIPEGVSKSHILSPLQLPGDYKTKFPTVIRDVATTGNSGSGVFRAGRKCLLGIMSRKIQTRRGDGELRDIAKFFVPATVIRTFLGAAYPF